MQADLWQDPVVKWKQELIRRDVEMDLVPGEAMILIPIIRDEANRS